jgi:putative oxidoreductase
MEIQPETVALFLARTLLAVLFIFQGYDKLFRVKPERVAQSLYPSFKNSGISFYWFKVGIWLNSFVEFAGGLLLLTGFLKNFILMVLGLNMLVVSFSMSWSSPMWDMKHVFPRFILLLILLLVPDEFDRLSIAYFFKQLSF